jgi:ubiquitin-protein ligase
MLPPDRPTAADAADATTGRAAGSASSLTLLVALGTALSFATLSAKHASHNAITTTNTTSTPGLHIILSSLQGAWFNTAWHNTVSRTGHVAELKKAEEESEMPKRPASSSGVGYGGTAHDTAGMKAKMQKAQKANFLEDVELRKQINAATVEVRKETASGGRNEAWESVWLRLESTMALVHRLKELFRDTASWETRTSVYVDALKLLDEVSRSVDLSVIFGGYVSSDDTNSLVHILKNCVTQADVVVEHGPSTPLTKSFHVVVPRVVRAHLKAEDLGLIWDGNNGGETELEDEWEFAQTLRDPFARGKYIDMDTEAVRYKSKMEGVTHRFHFVSDIGSHAFDKEKGPTRSHKEVRKLVSELSSYMSALPVEHGSSIFVRVGDDRLDLVRALIIGPEGTPYANGCFFFDIFIPFNYPAVAPKVKLRTTGGGQVRFNPNLYANGKVCLSLLGTWAGPGWVSNQSTLLQVLISIQSLILVPDPYFNEPGYEGMRNNPSVMATAEAYNKDLRVQTGSWAMLDVLKNRPFPEFNDVVDDHFFHKRATIASQLLGWASKDKAIASSAMVSGSESTWTSDSWMNSGLPLLLNKADTTVKAIPEVLEHMCFIYARLAPPAVPSTIDLSSSSSSSASSSSS